jgi:desulfoferrodoxin-like iron-binding protein
VLRAAHGEEELGQRFSIRSANRPEPRSEKGVPGKMPNLLGRRFRCETCNTEVLITKAGEGEVECCGQPMAAQQPRPLPSSD